MLSMSRSSNRSRPAPLAVVLAAGAAVETDPSFVGPMPKSPELDRIKISKQRKTKSLLKSTEKTASSKPNKTAPAASRATRAAGSSLVVFKRLPKDGEKLAPQAIAILKVLQKATKGMTVHELVSEKLNATILNTCQSPARIWTFYRKALIAGKFVEVK